MGDRIVVMNGGIIEQIGSPLEVFDRPKNRFVAGFVGSPAMNFIDGTLVGTSSGTAFRTTDGRTVPLGPSAPPPGPAVTAGIRPHHLRLDPTGPIRGAAIDVQPTGVETIILCRWNSRDLLAQTGERIRAAAGEQLGFSVDPANIHLFDGTSGERLAA